MNKINEKIFIKLFCFLGPIGNIIPIMPSIKAFRFYYFLLAVGVIYFFSNALKNQKAIKTIIYLFPIIAFLTISSIFSFMNVSSDMDGEAENPLIRLFLLISLMIFVIFIGNRVKYFTYEEKIKCIFLYLTGYILSLIIGYIFFIGFYIGIFSIDFISNFEVLTQMGYGLLRFSPGSYPNEYGIVSSYVLSILTLLLCEKNKITIKSIYIYNKFLYVIYLLTLIALFLTTTRAAYIAYILTLFYIFLSLGNLKQKIKRIIFFIVFSVSIIMIVELYIYDIFNIFYTAYNSLDNKDASAYSRILAWKRVYADFLDIWLVGIGFGKASSIHNTFLQIIFELGLIGVLIIGIYFLVGVYKLIFVLKKNKFIFINRICIIGLIHVIWFAMSNHNLNHHLTWFVIFSIYMLECNKSYVDKTKNIKE